MTSEGFQIYGLPPYAYYSAGLACYMYGPNSNQWMQDNHDVWNNSMDLAGIQNGGIVGFKYFGFGGLAKDSKGCKAFEGTKKGDGTVLELTMTPSGKGNFKIHVKLDDPWKGQEIGIEVSGSHVQAVSEGDTVTAFARLQHRGNTLHVWNVDIRNSNGELISSVRVTNYIIKQKK